MVKWNILGRSCDEFEKGYLDKFYQLGIKKEICEKLFKYAMYDNYSTDSCFFLSDINLGGNINSVRDFLKREIDKFDYQNEREFYSFGVTNNQYINSIENYLKARQIYTDIFISL